MRIVVNESGKRELEKEAIAFTIRLGENILEIAKNLVPVDTGELRDSLVVISNDNGVQVGSDVPYALMVEMGTRNQRAQAFLRPALDQIVNENK